MVPVLAIATLFWVDWLSGLIVLLTLPLLPFFAALIGRTTQAETEKRWSALASLSGHFLDVMRGLPTLVGYGRAERQVEVIGEVSQQHRVATMGTLRLAFMSSAALELLASISVAIVAVTVGLRLTHGSMTLQAGMLAILLAPEAYWPIRRVGAEFHAAADGAEAIDGILAELDAAPVARRPSMARRSASRSPTSPTPTRRPRARCSPASTSMPVPASPPSPDPPGSASRPSSSSRPDCARPPPVPCAPAASTSSPSARSCPPARCATPSCWATALTTRPSGTPCASSASRASSPRCRWRSRPRSATTGSACRPGSAPGSPWPGRRCPPRRCCSSTSRPPTSTPGRPRWCTRCSPASAERRTVVVVTHRAELVELADHHVVLTRDGAEVVA